MSNSKDAVPQNPRFRQRRTKRTSLTAPEGKPGVRLPMAFRFQKRASPNR